MLSAGFLSSMTNEEITRYAYQSENALTSTDLERELAARLRELCELCEVVTEQGDRNARCFGQRGHQ